MLECVAVAAKVCVAHRAAGSSRAVIGAVQAGTIASILCCTVIAGWLRQYVGREVGGC